MTDTQSIFHSDLHQVLVSGVLLGALLCAGVGLATASTAQWVGGVCIALGVILDRGFELWFRR